MIHGTIEVLMNMINYPKNYKTRLTYHSIKAPYLGPYIITINKPLM